MGMLGLVLATTLVAAPTAAPGKEDAVANVASRSWMRELGEELRNSNSARDRALSTLLWDLGADPGAAEYARRGKLLREAAAAAPNDRLVQSLWARADDEASGCDRSYPCLDREMAFARLEPDNAAAWLPVLHKAERDHDKGLRDAALVGISKADHHDGLFAEMVGAWLTIIDSHPLPEQMLRTEARNLASSDASVSPPSPRAIQTALAVSLSGMPLMPPSGVFRYCRAGGIDSDPAPPAACLHLGRLMAAGPSLIDRGLGLAFLREADEGKALEARRQLDWMIWQAMPRPYGNSVLDLNEDGRYTADLLSTGSEIRAIELLLQRRGIPLTPPMGWQKPVLPAPAPAAEPPP